MKTRSIILTALALTALSAPAAQAMIPSDHDVAGPRTHVLGKRAIPFATAGHPGRVNVPRGGTLH